uniref:Tc1-like transposase DDE domain-containing protein n=1 Tax=Globisporangium ultimum (strain ATCC 200006 / CBS 805.95 / DAOM BR144) TaxID=431595 RepID=K3W6L4_GLOUD
MGFNLDGSDGCKYYWHDLSNDKRLHGAVILVGNQNAFDYQETLITHLFEFIDGVHEGDYAFQHDNVSIHRACATKDFLVDLNILTIDWPALS